MTLHSFRALKHSCVNCWFSTFGSWWKIFTFILFLLCTDHQTLRFGACSNLKVGNNSSVVSVKNRIVWDGMPVQNLVVFFWSLLWEKIYTHTHTNTHLSIPKWKQSFCAPQLKCQPALSFMCFKSFVFYDLFPFIYFHVSLNMLHHQLSVLSLFVITKTYTLLNIIIIILFNLIFEYFDCPSYPFLGYL